jgi:hypothetical protein
MSIIQTQTTGFKLECYEGYHAFTSAYRAADTFKIALYTSTAQLDATTTVYTSSNEVTGTGYTAGGLVLTPTLASIGTTTGGTAYLDFANLTWTPAVFTTNGALIYNSSQGNRSVAVLAFGSNINVTTFFTITFPFNDQNNALIRYS